MAIAYLWKITRMKAVTTSQVNDAICVVDFMVRGKDEEDGVVAVIRRSTQLNVRDIDPDTFVPFEDLNEDLVVQWVKDSLSEDEHQQVIDGVSQALSRKRSSLRVAHQNSMPWSN